jgi:hypothetical protein
MNDRRGLDPLPFVCEIEVCGPGQYLGPNFTTGCLQCPAGQYSVGGAVGGCTQCPPGTYGSSTGLSTVSCSGLCAAGRFGSVSGLSSSSCEGACIAGYACPVGSTNGTVVICGVGQYSLAGAGVCTNCSAGSYGSSTGLTTAGCSGQCAAGRFGSVSGLSSSSCEGACIAGYACPAGSTNGSAAMCAAGQYSPSGASSCTQCPSPTPFSSPGSGSCFAACPDATWTAWLDVGGVEGAHSCFKPIASASTWTAANASCVALGGGSHLLTSRQVRVLAHFFVVQRFTCGVACEGFRMASVAALAETLTEPLSRLFGVIRCPGPKWQPVACLELRMPQAPQRTCGLGAVGLALSAQRGGAGWMAPMHRTSTVAVLGAGLGSLVILTISTAGRTVPTSVQQE